jgi:hypothetical protein
MRGFACHSRESAAESAELCTRCFRSYWGMGFLLPISGLSDRVSRLTDSASDLLAIRHPRLRGFPEISKIDTQPAGDEVTSISADLSLGQRAIDLPANVVLIIGSVKLAKLVDDDRFWRFTVQIAAGMVIASVAAKNSLGIGIG